jgi:hypothetical protein
MVSTRTIVTAKSSDCGELRRRFDKAFINISGEYDDDDQTSRGVTRPIAVTFAQQNPTLAGQLPNYPLPVQIWGQSRRTAGRRW